ncbi:MAG: GyrI-like domain-containing protein [Lachnospiraceae bacterium]
MNSGNIADKYGLRIEPFSKDAFAVIGMEGSTREGKDFVKRLWERANARFPEIAPLAKRNDDGRLVGIWGAMTDFDRTFQPWAHFQDGLYLAGVECRDDAKAPEGWTRWEIPGFSYLRVCQEGEDTFSNMLLYLSEQEISLAGAVQEFTDPGTGRCDLLFPVQRLKGGND